MEPLGPAVIRLGPGGGHCTESQVNAPTSNTCKSKCFLCGKDSWEQAREKEGKRKYILNPGQGEKLRLLKCGRCNLCMCQSCVCILLNALQKVKAVNADGLTCEWKEKAKEFLKSSECGVWAMSYESSARYLLGEYP